MVIQHESKNIKFVAYLRFLGIHPNEVQRYQRGKAKYVYAMTEEKWIDLKKKFDKSEFIKYAQCLDAVVDLAF